MQRQLDAYHLNYRFVDAIDKHDLHSKENRASIAEQLDINGADLEFIYKNSKDKAVGKDVGAVACLLSHIKVYSLMEKENVPIACILEDDGIILPTFPQILAKCYKFPGDILMLASKASMITWIGRAFLRTEKFKMYSLLAHSYKLMRYKKYYRQLTRYTQHRIILKIVKYIFLKYWRKISDKLSRRRNRQERRERKAEVIAAEIGALPVHDLKKWHKIVSGHYVVSPLMDPDSNITSAMGYVLKLSAASKWKRAVVHLSRQIKNKPKRAILGYASNTLEIDHIPRYLHYRGEVVLHILVPPCVRIAPKYISYSIRTS